MSGLEVLMEKSYLDRYKKLIEQNRYFEAHEILEEWWFSLRFTKTDEVLLVKGLINAAVSFELIKKERFTQGLRVWQNFKKYEPKLLLLSKQKQIQYQPIIDFINKIAKDKKLD